MGMYVDESYDTEVSQNRCHSPRHRTTFSDATSPASNSDRLSASFFLRLLSRVCLQSSAAGGLLYHENHEHHDVFCNRCLQNAPARRGKKNRDIARRFPFFRGDIRASTW